MLSLLGAGLGARAQAKPGGPRRIGILQLADPRQTLEDDRTFWIAMTKLGWILDDNIVVERAYANGNEERLAGLAQELISKRVEVILTLGQAAPVAAARATRTTPIVFLGVLWPIEQGLIDSFARPGRNVTGIASYTGIEVTNKRLEFLREIVPAAKRLSWVWPSGLLALETVAGDRVNMVPVVEAAAKKVGFESKFHPIRGERNLESVFSDIAAWRAQAIMSATIPGVAELALRHRLPSAFLESENVVAGGLLSYGAADSEWTSLVNRCADYVDRILRGARPGNLAVERPSRYELVINMKTAKALGLTIPQSLLLRANAVIE
jgi:putative ABC transport system substrate-binding protein